MKSVGTMLKQLSGLSDSDVTPWEWQFIGDQMDRTMQGEKTSTLSARQVEVIERIYNKHFGDNA